MVFIIASLLFACGAALAQQGPNAPGNPDSIIIGNLRIENHDTLLVDIIFAFRDSIISFELPLTWISSGMLLSKTKIVPADIFKNWDIFDTINYPRRMICVRGNGRGKPVYSNGRRVKSFTIKLPIYYSEKEESKGKWIYIGGYIDQAVNSPLEVKPCLIYASRDSVRTGRVPSLLTTQPYGNPFGTGPDCTYYLRKPQVISLELYNYQGKMLNAIEDYCSIGFHDHKWHYKDYDGDVIPSGAYFTHIIAEDTTIIEKTIIIR